jgi:hypothetical protein
MPTLPQLPLAFIPLKKKKKKFKMQISPLIQAVTVHLQLNQSLEPTSYKPSYGRLTADKSTYVSEKRKPSTYFTATTTNKYHKEYAIELLS